MAGHHDSNYSEAREADDKYRQLFDQMLDGFALCEIICNDRGQPIDYRFLEVNPAFARLTGSDPESVVGRTALEVLPETESRWIENFGKVALTGESIRFEDYFRQINRQFKVSAFRTLPNQFACCFTDVTGQNQAGTERSETKEQFLAMVDSSIDAIIAVNVADRITFFNRAAEMMFGYTAADALGQPVTFLMPDNQKALHVAAFNSYLDTRQARIIGTVVEVTARRSNGEAFPVDLALSESVVDHEVLFTAIIRDITERKRAELREATRSQTMTALASGAPLIEVLTTLVLGVEAEHPGTLGSVLLLDAAGTHLLTGAAPSLPAVYNEAIHGLAIGPAVGSCGTAAFRGERVVVTDIQTDPLWTEFKERASEAGLAACWSEPIRDSDGRVLGTFAFYYSQKREPTQAAIEDIESAAQVAAIAIERIQTERALAIEKERLSVTLRSIGDGVITTDVEGKIVLLNKTAEALTGWKSDEATGHPLSEVFNIIDEHTLQQCENPVDRVLASGGIVELANHTCLIASDGREILIADSGAPIYDSESSIIGVVLVFRDMTEKQQLENVIQKSQRLESLGVLAGGIAHDFNNLLGGIFGHIEIALEETTEKRVSACLIESLNNIDRARALTRQLVTFAKGGVPVKRVDNLFPFVRNTVQFALSGSSVSSRFQIQDDLWPCDFDKNQIGQVIENLVFNAQQAMPDGGWIDVLAENISVSAKEHASLAAGHYVKLSVKDEGVGIPKEILPNIFDPYYTTKPRGHGLGLSMCYSIISQHDGCIDVESKPGEGSTFHVYLSASSERLSTPRGKAIEKHSGSGTFLVMDDDEPIRNLLKKMLESFGYTVVLKENGKEAVDFFASETRADRKLAGMIFDLTIPGGMGGKEAIEEIRKLCSTTPVFVSSGYSVDAIMANPEEYGFTASIRKPFLMAELSEMLEKHLTPKK